MRVYETGSYATASKAIHITPQGIRKGVRSLESELRKPLFSESLKPTPYADALYAFAQRVSEEYSDLTQEFEAIAAHEQNIIRLGFATGTFDLVSSKVLDGFKKRYPHASFYCEEIVDESCDERLNRGIYDLAFTVDPPLPEFEGIKLLSSPIGLWVNSRSRLSKLDIVRISDLSGYRLATPMPGAKNVNRILERCADEGVALKEVVHLHQMHAIFDFVRQNRGVGTNVGTMLDSASLSDPHVVSVPFEDFAYTFRISWLKDRPLTDLESSFIDYVSKRFAKIQSKG